LYGKVVSAKCNPYYASIKSNKVRAHVGPGQNYKLVCEYISKGLPVMITAKYDHWRRVVDPDGTESWVHKSLLSSKRRVISRCGKYCELRKDSNDNSPLIAYIKKNVIMELVIVRGNWCKIEANFRDDKYVGWIKKENLFGVLDNETS
jgi:SH3-like domain-containing protein